MRRKLKILYIHNEKKDPKYGAHFINDLMMAKLREKGFRVNSIYPKQDIDMLDHPLRGIRNILFFYSLITKMKDVKKYNIIQGTTYTPLAFLGGPVPVVSHFGSTVYGFLRAVPTSQGLKRESKHFSDILHFLRQENVIDKVFSNIRSLRDLSDIEMYVARKSNMVIATSQIVKEELMRNKVPEEKIRVVHNAIEDFWFTSDIKKKAKPIAHLVYLGRMGDDAFTVKLKGITRLFYLLKKFKNADKLVIGMCKRIDEYQNFFSQIPRTTAHLSLPKEIIPSILSQHFADLYINPGRYEGFCLSLIEAMSQGLVPIIFPIGVAPEIIENGKNGFLVSSMTEMYSRINDLMHNPHERLRMAENAILTTKQFSADHMVKRLTEVFKEIV